MDKAGQVWEAWQELVIGRADPIVVMTTSMLAIAAVPVVLTWLSMRRHKKREGKKEDEENAVVQAVVFEVNDRDRVGYVTEDGGRRYCCDEALAKTSGCSPGRVIVRPKTELVEEIDPETKKKKMVEVENVDLSLIHI